MSTDHRLAKEALERLSKHLTEEFCGRVVTNPFTTQGMQVKKQVLQAEEVLFELQSRLLRGCQLIAKGLEQESDRDSKE